MKPLTWWQAFRKHKWLALAFDALLILLVFQGFSLWQQRDLLGSNGEMAPSTRLFDMQGKMHDIAEQKGRKTIVYFFAPWCSVCHASIGNLQNLREDRSEDELAIYAIALSWDKYEEVEEFVSRHELTIPVLLGDNFTAQDWKIRGFPTYYVLDSEGRIIERDMGYSTEIGLKLRS